ncbi:glycoside hydrolase family 75 protein, partial [Aaosphaeria arxii CBS 175.79]
ELPANLKAFYDANINGKCPNPKSIEYDSAEGQTDTQYCEDPASKALYLKDNKNGYADLDIDCDGANNSGGKCGNDPTGQGQTAFRDTVKEFGIPDLDANIHSYIVLGNDNSVEEGDGGEKFDPQSLGIKPLSVVAIVCGGQLFYGVWGDVNGGKLVGETSMAVGDLCFPNEDLSGNKGHGDHDVLYLAFPGDEALPDSDTKWKASSTAEFEESLATVGDGLVAKL